MAHHPIFDFITAGNKDAVEWWIRANPELLLEKNSLGSNPLMWAEAMGQEEMFSALIAQASSKILINVLRQMKQSQQSFYRNSSKLDIIAQISGLGFDFVCDEELYTVLGIKNQEEAKEIRGKSKDSKTPIVLAAKQGHWALVAGLLKQPDINLDWVDEETGDTLLHLACEAGEVHIVNEMIALKPELFDAKNKKAETVNSYPIIARQIIYIFKNESDFAAKIQDPIFREKYLLAAIKHSDNLNLLKKTFSQQFIKKQNSVNYSYSFIEYLLVSNTPKEVIEYLLLENSLVEISNFTFGILTKIFIYHPQLFLELAEIKYAHLKQSIINELKKITFAKDKYANRYQDIIALASQLMTQEEFEALWKANCLKAYWNWDKLTSDDRPVFLMIEEQLPGFFDKRTTRHKKIVELISQLTPDEFQTYQNTIFNLAKKVMSHEQLAEILKAHIDTLNLQDETILKAIIENVQDTSLDVVVNTDKLREALEKHLLTTSIDRALMTNVITGLFTIAVKIIKDSEKLKAFVSRFDLAQLKILLAIDLQSNFEELEMLHGSAIFYQLINNVIVKKIDEAPQDTDEQIQEKVDILTLLKLSNLKGQTNKEIKEKHRELSNELNKHIEQCSQARKNHKTMIAQLCKVTKQREAVLAYFAQNELTYQMLIEGLPKFGFVSQDANAKDAIKAITKLHVDLQQSKNTLPNQRVEKEVVVKIQKIYKEHHEDRTLQYLWKALKLNLQLKSYLAAADRQIMSCKAQQEAVTPSGESESITPSCLYPDLTEELANKGISFHAPLTSPPLYREAIGAELKNFIQEPSDPNVLVQKDLISFTTTQKEEGDISSHSYLQLSDEVSNFQKDLRPLTPLTPCQENTKLGVLSPTEEEELNHDFGDDTSNSVALINSVFPKTPQNPIGVTNPGKNPYTLSGATAQDQKSRAATIPQRIAVQKNRVRVPG